MLLFVFCCTVGAANDLTHNLIAGATRNGDCFGFASALGYCPAAIWILSGADFNGDTDFFRIRGNNLFTQFAYIHTVSCHHPFIWAKYDINELVPFTGTFLQNTPTQ